MKAQEFWMEFKKIFGEEKPQNRIDAINTWKNRGNFTKFIIPKISDVFEKFAMKTQCEYYNVDLIAWTDKQNDLPEQKAKKYKLKEHLWRLDAAVEHENDQTDWTDELVKLLYINCDLRVVIGYVPADLESIDPVLEYASSVVKLADEDRSLIRDGQSFMLILGKNLADASELTSDTYSAYVFNTDSRDFEAIY